MHQMIRRSIKIIEHMSMNTSGVAAIWKFWANTFGIKMSFDMVPGARHARACILHWQDQNLFSRDAAMTKNQ